VYTLNSILVNKAVIFREITHNQNFACWQVLLHLVEILGLLVVDELVNFQNFMLMQPFLPGISRLTLSEAWVF
jgi:hypothetical protein